MNALIQIVILLTALVTSVVGRAEMLEMYSADWCRYCQQAKKDILPEYTLIDEYKFAIINADREPGLARENNIKTMPTFILRDDAGVEIARQTGYHGLRKLKSWLELNRHK